MSRTTNFRKKLATGLLIVGMLAVPVIASADCPWYKYCCFPRCKVN